MLKKIFLSLAVIFGFAGYAYYQPRTETANLAGSNLAPKPSQDLTSLTPVPAPTPVPPAESLGTGAIDRVRSFIRDEEDDNEGGGRIPVTPIPVQTSPVPIPPPSMMTGSGMMIGRYKNGSYLGSVADAYYGNVQVKAIITNGQLSDVQFLGYPRDRNTSVQINTYATPILRTEAIKAQSAKVNAVSGASETSRAFVESLSSALTKAS